MLGQSIDILEEMLPLCEADYSPKLAEFQKAYCFRQLGFITHLGRQVDRIAPHASDFATAIVGRSLMEATFRLAGAAHSEATALKLVYTNVNEDLRRTQMFNDLDPDPPAEAKVILDSLKAEKEAIESLTEEELKPMNFFDAIPLVGLRNLYRASYHTFSKIAHGDYTYADICRRGERLQGDVVGSITLFACLAGRIATDLFELDEDFWRRLCVLHPDLQNQSS